MKKTIWLLVIAMSLCSWGMVYGQTEEVVIINDVNICDRAGYTGAMWGLCNAYCEAMDCDTKSVNAADEACDRVLDNFLSKSGGKRLICAKYGRTCQQECKSSSESHKKTCREQYDIAFKACKNDLACIENEKTYYQICVANTDVVYNLCTAECGDLNCQEHCYALHLKADEKCYNQFCNEKGCETKSLDACLYNNQYSSLPKCLKRCGTIIIK